MNTFLHDHTLPALPLTTPETLCTGVPALAAPLLEEDTLAVTLATLSDFVKPGGEAETLHRALVTHKNAQPGNANWLRPFWDDMYREWRDPLPLNMNYFFRLEHERWGATHGLARFILALARTAERLGRGELEAEKTRTGFLSMDQARRAFYTRIPCRSADELLPVELTAPLSIAVACQGYWFIVPLHATDNAPASAASLALTLDAIRREAKRMAKEKGPGLSPAAMTSAPREDAAAVRSALGERQINRLGMKTLEQSLLALCLDPVTKSTTEASQAFLGGPAHNRWFDKSLQIIATEEGEVGANFEHAGCDAGIWAWLLNTADSLLASVADGEGDEALPHRLLEWDVPDNLASTLRSFGKTFAQSCASVDMACRDFPALSRECLKSMRTSPDAFLQVAFQAAQYKIFGCLKSSYEAVSMRAYAGGRTECARGCTQAALAFAKALWRNAPQESLQELYRTAERAHLGRLVNCQRGLAVERYVYGLQTMYRLYGKELGLASPPAFFADPGWLAVKHDSLSTSGMTASGVSAFGFGPVVPDGFGVGYAPSPDRTALVITSFHNSGLKADAFVEAFTEASGHISRLLLGAVPQ